MGSSNFMKRITSNLLIILIIIFIVLLVSFFFRLRRQERYVDELFDITREMDSAFSGETAELKKRMDSLDTHRQGIMRLLKF